MELPYIIRVSLTMAAMYLTYKIFLSRDTFHALNRAAILASAAVSFVIPLLPIPTIFAVNASNAQPAAVAIGEITAEIADTETTTPLAHYLPYLMAIGAAAFALRFLVSTASIAAQAVRNQKIDLNGGIKLIISETIKSPVSWLRYIFMNRDDYNENSREILVHEMAHIRHRHSIDLMLMDLMCCVQWYNPAAWLLRRELCAVHEFQADKAVLASGFNAKKYQTLLIKKAAGRNWNSVANSLNHSNLKKRITMMTIQKKPASAALKALLPVAVAALCAVTFADCNTDNGMSAADEQSVKTPKSETFLVSPDFPGGELALRQFIAENVRYPEAAKNAKEEGVVYVQFTVTSEGKVANPFILKGSGSASIDEEALRVIKTLPDFTPGTENGIAIDVPMSLPIMFRL